ncbi:MAG: hypothetical protein COB36_13245 [Alphaproteobacteria bacterium]|nr:MAG: hypothetical protein COB36_13245 [Alphaproteobacteria bacterium]
MPEGANHQVLRYLITGQQVSEMVSKSLRLEHRNDMSSVKRISRISGVNMHTISNWYTSSNAPNSAHLLTLATIYPEVLKGVLEIIGRADIWRYCLANNIPKNMSRVLGGDKWVNPIYGDKFVHLNVVVNLGDITALNLRQLWLVSELQSGKEIKSADLTQMWGKSNKTSRRDIQGLIKIGMIKFVGPTKNGRYRLV